jgi:predicted DNA-binding protein (UPF0251 family)
MKPRTQHPIIRQLIEATKKDDEAFLQSLATLLRTTKRLPAKEQQRPDFQQKIVAEEPAAYDAARLDKAPCTVGEALRRVLDSNNMNLDDAASQLGISTDRMQGLIEEMMPLTSSTVPTVSQFFAARYGVNALRMRQWLITGLRELEMKNTEHTSSRIAARKKKP